MPAPMQVSIVIGTYNRAHLLKGTLEALASRAVPDYLTWGNSRCLTTARATRLRKWSPRSRTPRLLRCATCLNPSREFPALGIEASGKARGSIIAFTDDDVLPAPDWIAQLVAAIHRWNVPPSWLTGNQYLCNRLAIMEFESTPGGQWATAGRRRASSFVA